MCFTPIGVVSDLSDPSRSCHIQPRREDNIVTQMPIRQVFDCWLGRSIEVERDDPFSAIAALLFFWFFETHEGSFLLARQCPMVNLFVAGWLMVAVSFI